MPRGRGEARLHPNVRNRQTPRRAAWSVTAVHARPLDAPAPGPWSKAPSPTIERIGGRASPPSAHRMTVTHRQAALSGATVTPPEGWSDSAVEPTVRNQSRQQPGTSYAHGGTAAYLPRSRAAAASDRREAVEPRGTRRPHGCNVPERHRRRTAKTPRAVGCWGMHSRRAAGMTRPRCCWPSTRRVFSDCCRHSRNRPGSWPSASAPGSGRWTGTAMSSMS
jgi:hypothetical protein